MIQDPYKVLGVSEHCSDQELKKAYRDASKKYHPDANPANPEEAAERFKEIQEAYRQIVDARERGSSAYGGTGEPGGYRQGYGTYNTFDEFFNQWQNRQEESERTELRAARNYINSAHYQEAMTALGGVPEMERTGHWYYYAAYASQGMGNNVTAMDYIKRACDLEPENAEYRMFLNRLQNGGYWYTQRGADYGGFNPVSSSAGWCLSMVALNLCCNAGVCCV